MATPPFLNLNPEDIPKGEAEWMTPIIDAINQFAKQVQYCLNKQLSFADNFRATAKAIGVTRIPFSFAHDLTGTPLGVVIIAATDTTNIQNVVPFAPSGLGYHFNGSKVVVDSIGGTVAKHTYNITFLVIGQ